MRTVRSGWAFVFGPDAEQLALDECPEDVYNYYDDLEDPAMALQTIAKLTPKEAYWLADYVDRNLQNEPDRINDEIEKELAV